MLLLAVMVFLIFNCNWFFGTWRSGTFDSFLLDVSKSMNFFCVNSNILGRWSDRSCFFPTHAYVCESNSPGQLWFFQLYELNLSVHLILGPEYFLPDATDKQDWFSARDSCASMGMVLAQPKNGDLFIFVILLKNVFRSQTLYKKKQKSQMNSKMKLSGN